MSDDYTKESGGLDGGCAYRFAALPSTNTWAMQNLEQLNHGDVVVAQQQTGGRGRFQREWIAQSDSSLTLSLIIDPDAVAVPPPVVAQLVGLAVVDCLQKFAIEGRVKWPNDVLVRGRKIAGILAEGDLSAGKLVVGLGLNINMTAEQFQQAWLAGMATSMAIERGQDFMTNDVMDSVLPAISQQFVQYRANGPAMLVRAWQSCDAIEQDSKLTVKTEAGRITGCYDGIGEDGRLRLKTGDGKTDLLWSGEVERVVMPDATL